MTEREAALEVQLRERDEKIRRLEETVAALLKRIYGAKSEKIDPAQLELLLSGDEPGKQQSSDGADAPAEDDAANAKTRKRSKRRGPRWPENTPVIIEAELVPEEVQATKPRLAPPHFIAGVPRLLPRVW